MKDYSDIGLDSRLRKQGGIATRDRKFVDATTFAANYQIPTGGLSYSQLNVASRPHVAVVTTSKKQGTFDNIQDSINYVSSVGGGSILIKKGTYFPELKIEIPSNVELIGESTTNTIIDFTNTTFVVPFFASIQARGVSVTTDGTFAINNGSSSVTGTNSEFSTDGVVAGDMFFINGVPYPVSSVTNDTSLTLVDTFRGKNVSGQSVDIQQPVQDIAVRNLTVQNSAEAGMSLGLTINASVIHCHVTKCDGGISIGGYQGEVSYNACFENDVSASAFGISVSGKSSQANNNYISNSRSSGISVGSGATASFNYVANSDTTGIFALLTDDFVITNNYIIGSDSHGIAVGQACDRGIVNNNMILDSGDDGINIAGTGGSPTNKINVQGNVTHNEANQGIDLTANTANCIVTGNNTFGGVSDAGANTVANNV